MPANVLDLVPHLVVDHKAVRSQRLEPLEGFILSRVNGTWTVKSILKLCPVDEKHALNCLENLAARGLVHFR
jgi:hypothetical protein